MNDDGRIRPPAPRTGDDLEARRRVDLEARMARVRRYLREHHADVEPDPAFAGRVLARLERNPGEILGLAALRLLPAALALVLFLGWLALRTAPDQDASPAQPSPDDVISWLLEESGDGR